MAGVVAHGGMPQSNKFICIDKSKFNKLVSRLKELQDYFKGNFGAGDIFSNSRFYEIIIANALNHMIIPGNANTRDAIDDANNEYEYKHFKETSSNHSWTFNDYSDKNIKKLEKTKAVIFAHIDDTKEIPICDWYYSVPGNICSKYLLDRTTDLLQRAPKGHVNNRRMINFSENQLKNDLNITRLYPDNSGKYTDFINELITIDKQLEKITGVTNILTSNKFWEVLVGVELNHCINPEQGGRDGAHDAFDQNGSTYEYKIAKNNSWSFQDISDNVLNKYLLDKSMILGVVDKENIKVKKVYETDSKKTVNYLRNKLNEKKSRYKANNKELRRVQVSLSLGDINNLEAKTVVNY